MADTWEWPAAPSGRACPFDGVFPPRMHDVASLPTLDGLRAHVLQVLCTCERLDAAQTPLQETVVTRSGRPCGLFFQVQGPRLVRAYAVWAGEEGRLLFYDSSGRRFAQTRLTEAPDPLRLAG